MIHYFPLERLETRYTKHLDDSIVKHCDAFRLAVRRYYPDMGGREASPPKPGNFLNAPTSVEFKARQVAWFAQEVAAGHVHDGDTVFFSDLWHPGVIDLAYLAHFENIYLDVRGLLWAGSFTDADLMRGAERWAGPLENVIFDIADKVFVTSRFMADDVVRKRAIDASQIEVTYCPLDMNLPEPQQEREPIVVFNGRLTPEKQPWLFDRLKEDLAAYLPLGVEFVNAIERGYTKAEYYDLLSRAKVCVSFALEETFGFGLLEAARLGCIPVVPDRLSYPEFFPPEYRYSDYDDAADLVRKALTGRLGQLDMSGWCNVFDNAPARWFA